MMIDTFLWCRFSWFSISRVAYRRGSALFVCFVREKADRQEALKQIFTRLSIPFDVTVIWRHSSGKICEILCVAFVIQKINKRKYERNFLETDDVARDSHQITLHFVFLPVVQSDAMTNIIQQNSCVVVEGKTSCILSFLFFRWKIYGVHEINIKYEKL